jgi:hypothetical protein
MSFSSPVYRVPRKVGTEQAHFFSQATFLYSEERDHATIDCLCGSSVINYGLLGSTKHGISLTKPRFSINNDSAFVPAPHSFQSTFNVGKVRQLQGLSTSDLRAAHGEIPRIISSTTKLERNTSESFLLPENWGEIPLIIAITRKSG